jgi:CheY-like chemotaxis protein
MARILVIDDDAAVRELLREKLALEGHEVLVAAEGLEGLRLHREHLPKVVITDIIMPGRSGIELVFEIRQQNPEVKIITISGIVPQQFLDAGSEVGVSRAFTKPFDVNEIARAVRDLAR